MVITSENITQSYETGQQAADSFSTFLVDNIAITSSDNTKSIERKINLLTSLKDYLLANIDINSLPNKAQRLNFFKLITKITEQVEEFEIIIGRKDLEHLRRIGKRFGQKHQM